MNGTLGTPYRFVYTARGFTSGLTLFAKVIKPNGSVLGTFSLVEFSDPAFVGVYYFDMLTTQLMPEGEYAIVVTEDANFKQTGKVSMRLPSAGEESFSICEPIIGRIEARQILGKIQLNSPILGVVSANAIVGRVESKQIIKGVLNSLKITARIETPTITGVVKC